VEARILERGGTKAELKFQAVVKGFKKNYTIERGGGQFPYRIDFALPTVRLAVEIDGESHRSQERRERDRRKDEYLGQRGWTVLRFTNREVLRDPRAVADRVWAAMVDLIPEDEPCPVSSWA